MDEKGITQNLLKELGDYAKLICFDEPIENNYSSALEFYLKDTFEYGLASEKFNSEIDLNHWYGYLYDPASPYEEYSTEEIENGCRIINRTKEMLSEISIEMPDLSTIKSEIIKNDIIKFYSFIVNFQRKENVYLKSLFKSRSTDNISCISDPMLTSRNEELFEIFSQIILRMSNPEFLKEYTKSLIELENALNQIMDICEWYLFRKDSITMDFVRIKYLLARVKDDLESKYLKNRSRDDKSERSLTALEKMYQYLTKYIIECTAEDNKRIREYMKGVKIEKRFIIDHVPAENLLVGDIILYAKDREEELRSLLAYSRKKYRNIIDGKLQGYLQLLDNEATVDALYVAIMITEVGEMLKKEHIESRYHRHVTSDAKKSMYSMLADLDAPLLPKRVLIERLDYQYYAYHEKAGAYLLLKEIQCMLDTIRIQVVKKDSISLNYTISKEIKKETEHLIQIIKSNLDFRIDRLDIESH